MAPSFDIHTTLGALLIGFAASSAFYGIFISQIYVYMLAYPADRLINKFLVYSILLLETVNQCFVGHAVYIYTITDSDSLSTVIFANVPWTLILQATLSSVIATIVRGCFTIRVWRFSNHNWLITGTAIVLIVAHLGASVAFANKSFELRRLIYLVDVKNIAMVSLSLGAFTDVFIAAALCYFLRQFRTGRIQSDFIVNNLTFYAVNTGLVTSAIAICTLVLYNQMPENFIFMAVFFVMSKLFSISFMANLNTRPNIKGRQTDRDTERGTEGGTQLRRLETTFPQSPLSASCTSPQGRAFLIPTDGAGSSDIK